MLARIGAALSAHDARVAARRAASPRGARRAMRAAAAKRACGARRQPSVVDVQILRAGQLVLLCVPAELTTMAGRRLREAVHARARACSGLRVMCRLQLLQLLPSAVVLSCCVRKRRGREWGVGRVVFDIRVYDA